MPKNLINPPRRLLLGPGPSTPDPRVLHAMAAPLVGHLDPFFIETMTQVMDGLRRLWQTANHHTIPMSGTGTAGLEALMLNLVEPGDEVVVGVIGYFGERLAELARRAGATVRTIEAPYGEILDPADIARALETKPAKLVAVVHAETSTGACQPLEPIGRIVRERGGLLLADCVTSLGGMSVAVDDWLVDAVGSCSQKCIGAPPGLGPVTAGPRAMEAMRARRTKPATWYFDFELLFKYWGDERRETGDGRSRAFHHTAPVANIYGFKVALDLIHAEGMAARFARHRAAHERLVAGLEAMGLTLFTPASHRLPMLNVVNIPDGVDDMAVRRALLEDGIEISGGFGPLAGKTWRIGLMGYNATPPVVDTLLDALSRQMRPVTRSAGRSAAGPGAEAGRPAG